MSESRLTELTIWVMAKGYTPDEGGMQTYAQAVAEAYARAGAKVTVFTQSSAGPRDIRLGGCQIIDIGPGSGAGVAFGLLKALRNALKNQPAPDFVHGTTWRTSVIPMVLGLPYIVTFHGREFMYPRGLVLRLMRRVARKAQGVCTVSFYSAQKLADRLNVPAKEITVAWNGIGFAPKRRQRGLEKPPLLFTLCRLEPRKNILACISACAAMRDQGLSFRYVIAGRGPQLEAIREMVKDLDLSGYVEIAGFVEAKHAAQLYADCDIFLHPQIGADKGRDFEGFGIAIADAMIAESAVIIGREGGSIELVEQGISGIAIDGEDQTALNDALKYLLINKKKRASMARAARQRAEELFTWERHIDTLLDSFDKSAAADSR